MDYSHYEPIPVEGLPATYIGVFQRLKLTFTPPNDTTVIRTLTGKSLELICTEHGRRGDKTPVVHAGYQKAVWELREGHLRWCPTEQRLYRRDPDVGDHPGERYLLNSWHPVKTIDDEYGIDLKSQQSPAYVATILREAKRLEWFAQVERGIRIDPCVWVRRDGHVVRLVGEDTEDLAVTQTFDPAGMSREAIRDAERICRWLTVDEKSYRNLVRMFATPWLEPFKQFTYVLSGHGGDGKTLVMSQLVLGTLGTGKVFPAFNVQQFCVNGSYTINRESMLDAMDGMAFAYDDESGDVTEHMLPSLRALSTGTQMQARVIGGKYRTIQPTATIVLCTNQGFADSSESSDRRRFVKVEFHANNGRSYDEYHAIELFARAHPAAVFALSCELWEQGDVPDLVNLSPARQLSDEMYWVINEILANQEQTGQPIASRDKFRATYHRSLDDGIVQLLGLKNSSSRMLDGKRSRVVRVDDWDRFGKYRATVVDSDDDTPEVPSPPSPIDGPIVLPSEVGFAAEYVRADQRKVARDWKQLAQSPNVDTSRRPTDSAAYAVVPHEGFVVVDMDVPHDGGDTGWTVWNRQVGLYGTPAFPATYLVGTPSGGVHAYYRVPAAIAGQLKNAAHPKGMPVDLRVDGKGYVIGAGSHVTAGDYRLLDLPAGDVVPELSERMCRWLIDTPGYVESHTPMLHTVSDDGTPRPSISRLIATTPGAGDSSRPPVDMSPIPEGSRNTDLHAWAYGRAANHPDNWPAIRLDLFERGRLSGLPESECATIWNSIMRELGGAR